MVFQRASSIIFLTFLFSCSPSEITLVYNNDIARGYRIITLLEHWQKEGEMIGGELLILKGGKNIFHASVGWRDKEKELPFEKNTISRIRSMTKPLLGTAVLMLVEQGKISLDDKVGKYLDEYKNGKAGEITIRELLTHTAGFEHPGYPGGFASYNNLEEVVKAIAETGPAYEPGSRFHYSDAGSSILAAVVEKVSGQSSGEYLKEKIIEPLKMNDTHYQLTEIDSSIRKRVSCVYYKEDEWAKIWDNNDPLPG